jgi:hypothetical protein
MVQAVELCKRALVPLARRRDQPALVHVRPLCDPLSFPNLRCRP